jgi:gamma-glutamylcyclotransferase (GGCT)/AIG2-like uncharacterized protein YtfP
MESNKLETIVALMNSRRDIQSVGAGHFENTLFSEAEHDLMVTYRPHHSLIVYGTLAPGAPNHHIVGHIKGSWHKGTVVGTVENLGWGAGFGYLGFRHSDSGNRRIINVFVLQSEELTANWQMLDEFEGSDYSRLLSMYVLENGTVGVGNIYSISEMVSKPNVP